MFILNPPDLPLHLPSKDYANILGQVKEGVFEVVVIPAFVLPDEIINATKNTYKLAESIKGFDIYVLPTSE